MERLIMAMRAAFLYLILFLAIPGDLNAQTWDWINTFGSPEIETVKRVISLSPEEILLTGTFNESLNLYGEELSSIGDQDIFIAKVNTNKETIWALSGGSILDDGISAMEIDPDGNIICAGSYWQKASFGLDSIQAEGNPKGLFILKLNPQGEELWLKKMDGSDLKELTDIVVDSLGNIFLCGFFDQELHLEDTTLISNGSTDLFLAKYLPTGDLQYARQTGYKGDTRAFSLDISANGNLVLGGFYNDTTIINLDTLPANTTDRDVFLALFDQEGNPIWGRKAGGVHDDELVAVAFGSNENIWATGYLVGVMNLGQGVSIQSSNGNSDIYLLKYDVEGNPLAARALGGSLIQQTTNLKITENEVLISGFYQGDMTFDTFNLSAGDNLSGFLAGFDLDINTQWVQSINGEGNIFVDALEIGQNQTVWIGGSFQEAISLNDTNFISNGAFDIFLARLNNPISSVFNPTDQSILNIYPNPLEDTLRFETNLKNFNWAILNYEGKALVSGKNDKEIKLHLFPPGIYTLYLQNRQNFISQKFIKK